MMGPSAIPATRYAKSGNVHVAYQVFGEGPIDLVFFPGFVSNIETLRRLPSRCSYVRCQRRDRLATMPRVSLNGTTRRPRNERFPSL